MREINLGDAALHDEEVRVVHVELHRVEQVFDLQRRRKKCTIRVDSDDGGERSTVLEKHASFYRRREIQRSIGHLFLLRGVAIDEVLVLPVNHNLATDRNLLVLLVSNRAPLFVFVVENDGNRRFRHARLPLLVHQL